MTSKLLSKALMIAALFAFIIGAASEAKAQGPMLQDGSVSASNRPFQLLTSYNWQYTNPYYYTYVYITVGTDFNFYYDGKKINKFTFSGSGGVKFQENNSSFRYFYKYYYWYDYDPWDNLAYYNYYRYNYSTSYAGGWAYPFFGYQYYDYPEYTARMRFLYTGTAPNRKIIFEWYNLGWYYPYYNHSKFQYQCIVYEGTNNIEFHYGPMDRGDATVGDFYYNYFDTYGYAYYPWNALIGFSSYWPKTTDYINIDPNGDGDCGYNNWESGRPSDPLSRGYTYYVTLRDNATFDAIQNGDVVLLSYGIQFKEVYPEEDVTLVRNNIYGNGTTDVLGNGNEQKPGVMIKSSRGTASVHQWISGPISFPTHPNFQVIYDATNTIPENTLTRFSTATPGATPNMGFGAAGNLDLTNTAIKGGLYHLESIASENGTDYDYDHYFNIALQRDLEVTKPYDPKANDTKKYPLSARVPVVVKFTNRGLDDIDDFYAIAKIYDDNDVLLQEDSVYWEAEEGDALTVSESVDLTFRSFRAPSIGLYKFTVYTNHLGDQEAMNNTWPWSIYSEYVFEVAPEIEAEAFAVVQPNNMSDLGDEEDIYVGRPVSPQGRFKNNGITDISDAPVSMEITELPSGDIVYSDNTILEGIPQGMTGNFADAVFDEFIPPSDGDYRVCITITALDDDVTDNNTFCDTFTVVHALNGIYTIGPDKNTGDDDADSIYNSRNFTTIQKAIDALYQQGVTGPVTFEFTTNTYDIGSVEGPGAAIDLMGTVIGMSATNTVTFKPSNAQSLLEANVKINMYSGSGIGVIIGQTLMPANLNAVIYSTPAASHRDYANSNGYFIFDGGSQRALKFILHSTEVFNTAFYLAQGASNISIKNCIITHDAPANAWDDYSLPVTGYSSGNYSFQTDARTNGTVSYSAAVLMRSRAPQDEINYFNLLGIVEVPENSKNLDTLVNHDNLIYNNDISGFAYGVASIGVGVLHQDGQPANFYNTNNTISSNLIHNVSRAGIFLGFEDNTNIEYNKISGVANATSDHNAGTDVAGIMLGGEQMTTYLGYNNMNITIHGNEISNVGAAIDDAANNYAYGIKVEQCRNDYSDVVFPSEENTVIMNNAIWGIVSNHANTNRIGVRLMTERNNTAGAWNVVYKTPQIGNYFTSGDYIVNNTIIIPDDGFNTAGITAGVAVQQSNETVFENNAIAVIDDNGGSPSNVNAAIYYQGLLPGTEGGIISDRNVYWLVADGSPTDSAAIFRFLHIDENSTAISDGSRNEFITMNQWQMFSGSDFVSVIRDFTNDMTMPNIADPTSELRINSTPTWPVGSALNNRGERFDFALYDLEGNPRGSSGQRYDIGAFEFPGVLLNSDIEITSAHAPGAYRSSAASSATFSEAEYIMAEAPIEVKASLRNNGSLAQTGVDVKVQIYRQKPRANYTDPTEFYDEPELEETVIETITPSETEEVVFNLADGIGKEFYPKTYGEWYMKYVGWSSMADSMYTMPGWFATMRNNVTPLYKIVISVRSDEDNYNNVLEKVCRFYLKRSELNMVLSVVNSAEPLVYDDDILAGIRNYDSLVSYLAQLGWVNTWNTDEIDTSLAQYYDVFDRQYWEPRAVNYKMYNILFWSDADEDALTQQEILDMKNFVNAGTNETEKNLLIGSQEMVRLNHAADPEFVEGILSAKLDASYPTDPLNGTSYNAGQPIPTYSITDDTKWIKGVELARNLESYILKTGVSPFPDPDPLPGLMTLNIESAGLSTIAYQYNPDVVVEILPDMLETTMGVATSTLTSNVVVLGVDWRHFGDGELVMRSLLDYVVQNGGVIIPIELLSFDAQAYGNRIELEWATASEYQSSHFEVERAVKTDAGRSLFVKVGGQSAAGESSDVRNYNFVDGNVDYNTTYVYRLKMVDLDGQYEYSGEVEVAIGNEYGMVLNQPVPNPVKSNAVINYVIEEAANVEIVLFDLNGKEVRTLFSGMANSGENELKINVGDLNSGVYTYVLKIGDRMLKNQLRIVK